MMCPACLPLYPFSAPTESVGRQFTSLHNGLRIAKHLSEIILYVFFFHGNVFSSNDFSSYRPISLFFKIADVLGVLLVFQSTTKQNSFSPTSVNDRAFQYLQQVFACYSASQKTYMSDKLVLTELFRNNYFLMVLFVIRSQNYQGVNTAIPLETLPPHQWGVKVHDVVVPSPSQTISVMDCKATPRDLLASALWKAEPHGLDMPASLSGTVRAVRNEQIKAMPLRNIKQLLFMPCQIQSLTGI